MKEKKEEHKKKGRGDKGREKGGRVGRKESEGLRTPEEHGQQNQLNGAQWLIETEVTSTGLHVSSLGPLHTCYCCLA